MHFALVPNSANRKTGPMAVASASKDSCPSDCPMRAACYRDQFPLNQKQCRLTWKQLITGIRQLPPRTLWRYGDIGDLPGRGAHIDADRALELATVGTREAKRPYCYSHKVHGNGDTIREMIARGFTVNISAEGLYRADLLADLDVGPVVTVLPRSLGDWRTLKTPAGRKVIRCPHEYQGIQCVRCGGTRGPLCSWPKRDFIIGLTAHGRVRKVEAIIERMEANKGKLLVDSASRS